MTDQVKVGIIGTGNIAPAYVRGCAIFPFVDLVACADIIPERAAAFAEEHGLTAYSVEELLALPDIEIVINLTVPRAHTEVDLQIIGAGKHAYSEKPFGVDRDAGQEVIDAANKAGVRVGCAPDTFLGGGVQTCRKLIDEGWIGEPVAATAFMVGHGHESWHPNPWFYYDIGGGPMFDMGPYYLTALINLLGPIERVAGSTKKSFVERVATSELNYGKKIDVKVDTHLTALLDFENGPVCNMIMSFDVWKHHLPIIEIYGTEGTLAVPDPNTFKGPVRVWRTTDPEWREVPLTHSDAVGRGIGVADMAKAIREDRPARASGDLAFHVLDVMQAVVDSSKQGAHVEIESTCKRPAPLPLGLGQGEMD
jgi:predicted dehydrogenase